MCRACVRGAAGMTVYLPARKGETVYHQDESIDAEGTMHMKGNLILIHGGGLTAVSMPEIFARYGIRYVLLNGGNGTLN